ncbi:helicase-exonuclease AddAB subunit AddA [Vagococcus penaei]|uniref:ATP-dependent helicase/nuclease subunit A n=1 Tax=Vagococcus penaei TaxID=633807 RepID=A0A1Q2D7Q3_9ENTE|nr:helicase-exonuclease AddAB subunit AddA [Vagococcus penaei]AQP54434.1 helicase-exonuclease AddAB subunit AddA [Vagococcus penaei]RSU06351.1 helicase-exonuclease AddAB subunit AddA [Vagococcus penaei]
MSNIPIKPANSQFTDEQWRSVYDGGNNLLISASAGSGKTTVLVERVIQKIKQGVGIDELLIVTYTEAAAKEMKARIQVAIQESVNQESDVEQKQHLVRQLSLLPTANISTLHAFCLQVIRKYYYLIDIDPVFRLLTDETENMLLMEDVWFDLREELYGKEEEIFYHLTENFSNDRSDDGLTRLIFSLQTFARANPDPVSWLDSLANQYRIDSPNLADVPLYQTKIKPSLKEELLRTATQLRQNFQLIEGEPDFDKTIKILQEDIVRVQYLQGLVETDACDELYQVFQTMKFSRIAGPSKKTSSPEIMETYEQVKLARKQCKEAIEGLGQQYFAHSPAKILDLMLKAYPLVKEMSRVAKEFMQAFRQSKSQKNLVDFNDLEHFTLAILANNTTGEWVGTEASTYYRQKFKEILVDEYQDINQLQESILYWLRQPDAEQGNFFMVGDVKQSIYAFRLADPTLFIDKYTTYANEIGGRRIILAENFRSRSQVLDFTNYVFMQLMTHDLGQIDYDENAKLITGFTAYPEEANYETEIMIYESETEDEETDSIETLDFVIDDKTEGELLLIGLKIKELIAQEYPIYRKKLKQSTPLTYKDIVLLTPTKKNNLVILDVFKRLGIPLFVNDTQNYFQATEIKVMVALLQMIDNPYQDISVAAVLRSPIVGLQENDLALLRTFQPKGYFYDSVLAYLAQEEQITETFERIHYFIEQFNHWREVARRESLATLIWKIYQETGFLDYVGGMPSGRQRQANLHALYERASAYENMNFKGLFQFVRLIEKMQEKDRDLAEPNQLNEDEDAVRVMTIHASKGLEFPVVFVLDLAKQFNLQDINQTRFIFDEHLGAGIKYLDSDQRVNYQTLPYSVLREEKKKKLLAEEMRKLYVALTRAEQKLFLVGSYKNKEVALTRWQKQLVSETVAIDAPTKLVHRSLMDWIGMSLVRHPNIQKEYPEIDVLVNQTLGKHPMTCQLTFYQKDVLLEQASHVTHEVVSDLITTNSVPNPQKLKEITDRLNFVYPDEAATLTTSYQAVSEIKRVFEDPDDHDLPLLDLTLTRHERPTEGYRYVTDELATPTFMTVETEPSAAQIGTATHLLMQLIPLDKKPTRKDFIQLLDRLVEDGLIEKSVADAIDCEHLVPFFTTEFGESLLKHHQQVKREQPFSLLLKASQLFDNGSDDSEDTVLVHGIIDGYYQNGSEVVLYDFKTDYVSKQVTEKELTAIKKRYQGQLNLYKLALTEVLNQPVTQVKLILLGPMLILDS